MDSTWTLSLIEMLLCLLHLFVCDFHMFTIPPRGCVLNDARVVVADEIGQRVEAKRIS